MSCVEADPIVMPTILLSIRNIRWGKQLSQASACCSRCAIFASRSEQLSDIHPHLYRPQRASALPMFRSSRCLNTFISFLLVLRFTTSTRSPIRSRKLLSNFWHNYSRSLVRRRSLSNRAGLVSHEYLSLAEDIDDQFHCINAQDDSSNLS